MTVGAVKLAASFTTIGVLHVTSASVMMGAPSTLTQITFLLFSSIAAASYSNIDICGDPLSSKAFLIKDRFLKILLGLKLRFNGYDYGSFY